MPIFPKPEKRPWMAAAPSHQGHVYTTFYSNAAWRRLRRVYLAANPLCRHCESRGIITPATDIDHIQPINPENPYDTKEGRYGQPLDTANLQPLCHQCHIIKTAKTRNQNIETR